MARRDWSSNASAQDWILKSLREFKTGATENMLNTRHDPIIISQLLNTLVERGVVTLHIDENKVGTERRVYRMAN